MAADSPSLAGRAVWGLSHHQASDEARELAVSTLIRVYDQSQDENVRYDCVYGLGYHGGDAAVTKLKEIANSEKNQKLRSQAQSLLPRQQ